MSSEVYQRLKAAKRKIGQTAENGENRLLKYAQNPLRKAGYLGGEFFSYILGFKWLIDFSYRFESLPKMTIELPTITYGHRYDRFRGLSAPEFAIKKYTYQLNPISALFVPINHIMKTIGKVIGWLLVSVYTIPANLILRAYNLYENMTAKNAFEQQLEDGDKLSIAKGWVNDYDDSVSWSAIPTEAIASHIGLETFFSGFMAHMKEKLASSATTSTLDDYTYQCCKNRFSYYTTARQELLRQQRETPESRAELEELRLSEKFIKQDLFFKEEAEAPPSSPSWWQRGHVIQYDLDAKRLYAEAQRHALAEHVDMAIACWSAIPKQSPLYKSAAEQCASLLIANGRSHEATLYSQESGDSDLVRVSQTLASGTAGLAFEDVVKAMQPKEDSGRTRLDLDHKGSDGFQHRERKGVPDLTNVESLDEDEAPQLLDSKPEKPKISQEESWNWPLFFTGCFFLTASTGAGATFGVFTALEKNPTFDFTEVDPFTIGVVGGCAIALVVAIACFYYARPSQTSVQENEETPILNNPHDQNMVYTPLG